MEIQQMRYFLKASETLNFATAANACFTSRQNISRSVKSLESEFGVLFFTRGSSGMVLTPEGVEATARIKSILSEIDAMGDAFRRVEEDFSPLEVACTLGVLDNAPDSVVDFHGCPVRVSECDYDTCFAHLESGQADVALVFGLNLDLSAYESTICRDSSLCALVGKGTALASMEKVTLKDLSSQHILLHSSCEQQYERVLDSLGKLGYDRQHIEVITSETAMRRMVRRGNGVAIASSFIDFGRDPDIASVPFANRKIRWQIAAIRKAGPATHEDADRYIRHLKSSFDEQVRQRAEALASN